MNTCDQCSIENASLCDFCGSWRCDFHGKWIENIFYCDEHSCWKCLSDETRVLLNHCTLCNHIYCDEHGHDETGSCEKLDDHCADCCELDD